MNGSDFGIELVDVPGELSPWGERNVLGAAEAIVDYDYASDDLSKEEGVNGYRQTAINLDHKNKLDNLNSDYSSLKDSVDSVVNDYDTLVDEIYQQEGAVEDEQGNIVQVSAGIKQRLTRLEAKDVNLDGDITSLKSQLTSLLLENVNVAIESDKSYIYKGYTPGGISIKATAEEGKNSIAVASISRIEIYDPNDTSENRVKSYRDVDDSITSSQNIVNPLVYSFTPSANLTGNQTFQSRVIFKNTSKYGLAVKTSDSISVNIVNPIYYGVTNTSSSFDAQSFTESNSIESKLYSRTNPANKVSGKTVSFPLTSTNDRAWLLTTEATIKGTYNGFDFPFNRYQVTISGLPIYYLYISKGQYSVTHAVSLSTGGTY